MRKLLPGIIPLFILIAIGVVLAGAGGVYVVRKEFIKRGQSGKAALDEKKIAEQLKNPAPLESPSPEPTPQLAPVQYKYEPAESQNSTEAQAPVFTINPPAGWSKEEKQRGVMFKSPEDDEEDLEPPLIWYQPANIQVIVDFLDNYDTFKQQGYSESKMLDTVVNVDLKQKLYGSRNPVYLTDQRTTFAGQEAHLLEMKVRLDNGVSERAMTYVMIKNKHAVLVSGHALDSAWSKRAATLKSSLSTFRFTD